LYGTSGSTDDFTYGELGIPSYTYEVGPGSGACAGFTPPYSCQTGFWNANLPALLYFARSVRQPYVSVFGPTPTALSISTTVAASTTTAAISATFNDNAFGPSGVGRPGSQIVISAEAFLDVPPWAGGVAVPLTLADGDADADVESFTGLVPISGSLTSRRTIFVRGIDANGNAGPVRAGWMQPFDGTANGPGVASIALSAGVITSATQLAVSADVSHTLPITVVSAEIYVDAPPWLGGTPITMTLSDNAADAAREMFTATLDVSALITGEHRLFVRGADSNGRFGPVREASVLIWEASPLRVYVPVVAR
jgi:hypothetical protein